MGKVPNLCEADEVLEICTAKTAESSLPPYDEKIKFYANGQSRTPVPTNKKRKPRGAAVCSRNTLSVGVDVRGDPKTNDYRNQNGGSKHIKLC